MVYLRAETSQIDAWAKLGNNISWEGLLPYYEKSEHLQIPTEDQLKLGASYDASLHGFEGPLKVSWPKPMVGSNFSSILNATYDSMGLSWNEDPNSGHMRGYNAYPVTVDPTRDMREDAVRAYYLPLGESDHRPNLGVYLNATVEHITWESDSHESQPFANGVTFRNQFGKAYHLTAKKEVILSAGSLVSPLILERSGVGNPA